MTSLLDRFYAAHSNRRLFFRQGWGNLPLLRDALHRGPTVRGEVPAVRIVWGESRREGNALFRQGTFQSPFSGEGFPAESRMAHVELVLPPDVPEAMPVCVHFAATGDEGFARRRHVFGLPLLRRGIGSLILENPYYGRRRPPDQQGKMLNRFSDLGLMGMATVMEGRSLLGWLRAEGFGRLGVCGISMGGHMAAQVGTLANEPVAIAACITPHSPSAVFTEGVLRTYCAWDILGEAFGGAVGAVAFAREVLDGSDLRRYPRPACPEAALIVGALGDAYIPPESPRVLHAHWPGSGLRWLRTGHVGAFLFHRRTFVDTVEESFKRLIAADGTGNPGRGMPPAGGKAAAAA